MKLPLIMMFGCVVFCAAACTSVTEESIEQHAKEFIEANVVFYAQQGNTTVDFKDYTIERFSIISLPDGWMVDAYVSASLDGQIKGSDIKLIYDSSGKLRNFNGRSVK